MKKSIFYILALLLVLSCTVSCKVMKEPEMDAVTDPLTYWNTYIMKDPPKPFTYFSCTWNHPLHSSLSAPTSSDPEVIAEVLRRLRTLNVTEAQKTEPESSERTEQFGTMAMLFDWGVLELSRSDASAKSDPRLRIMLSGDMLVLYFSEDNFSCFRLDSDKTEFKASMADYAEAHRDTP